MSLSETLFSIAWGVYPQSTKMSKFFCNTWYDHQKITDKMIYHSFRATWIANKLNHSEDELFKTLQKITENYDKMSPPDNIIKKFYLDADGNASKRYYEVIASSIYC